MISPLGLGKCGLQAPGWVAACHPSAHLASIFLCPTQESRNLVENMLMVQQMNKKDVQDLILSSNIRDLKANKTPQLDIVYMFTLLWRRHYRGHSTTDIPWTHTKKWSSFKKYCLQVSLSHSDSLTFWSVLYITGIHCHLRNSPLSRKTSSQQSNCPVLCQYNANIPT